MQETHISIPYLECAGRFERSTGPHSQAQAIEGEALSRRLKQKHQTPSKPHTRHQRENAATWVLQVRLSFHSTILSAAAKSGECAALNSMGLAPQVAWRSTASPKRDLSFSLTPRFRTSHTVLSVMDLRGSFGPVEALWR